MSQKFMTLLPDLDEPDKFMTSEQFAKARQKYEIRKAIKDMNSALIDERRLELGEIAEEGLFDGNVSDEYWGFLSRYEEFFQQLHN